MGLSKSSALWGKQNKTILHDFCTNLKHFSYRKYSFNYSLIGMFVKCKTGQMFMGGTVQWLKPYTYTSLETNNLKIQIQYKYLNFTIRISTKEFAYSSDIEACSLSHTHMHTCTYRNTETSTIKVPFNQIHLGISGLNTHKKKNIFYKVS